MANVGLSTGRHKFWLRPFSYYQVHDLAANYLRHPRQIGIALARVLRLDKQAGKMFESHS